MLPNYCCCCFNENEILIPIKTKSSNADGKTLLDYFNCVLSAYAKQEPNVSELICMRCSKALQVAYHFINMVKESKFKEKENNIRQNKLNFENRLKHQAHKCNMPSNANIAPLKLQNTLEIFKHNSNTDIVISEPIKQDNLEFKCIICNKIFENKQYFVQHNKEHHKEITPFKCKLCSFYTCYTQSLFKHYEKAHDLNNVSLDLYHTKKVPKMDKEMPYFEITYLCSPCNFKSCNQISVDEHWLEMHSIDEDKDALVKQIFNCPSCHRSFKSLKSAKIHYSMYHVYSFKRNKTASNRKFECGICGKLFDLKSSLFLHRRICERRETVNCNFCNVPFASVVKYERHLQQKHSVAIKHECEICSKTFKCSEYLTVHRKRHNERYHQCDLCAKNYISNADLKVHKQRIHTNNNVSISCTTCGMRFEHLSLLRYHESRAHNRSLHKCFYCEFVSHSSSVVKIHQYKHTGKPYKCPLCPREFAFRKVLRQHCEKCHLFCLSNEEMADMFKQTHGYISRFDAFSQQNSLEMTEIKELGLENELQEFGLTVEDIMEDLFHSEINGEQLP